MKKNNIKFSRKLHENPHKGKNRKNSSHMWMARHINDPYVALANEQGYRSRAAFKLLEIQSEFRIFKNAKSVLDLGAAPGSWSQVVENLCNKNTKIVAVDLLPIDEMQNVHIICGDIYADNVIEQIKQQSQKYDIIISDIAPNTTGHASTDHLRILDIAENVFLLVQDILNVGGSFVIKIFQGGYEQEYIANAKKYFQNVKRFKPNSSRKESPEIYLVAQNYYGKI